MSGKPIRRMDDRMDAVFDSLVLGLPARQVKRSWLKHYTDHTPQELADGVVMLVSGGEGDYKKGPGMVALEGIHRMLLICHLKVAESSLPQAVEDAELDLIEDIKAWARSPIHGVGIEVVSADHSRQLEHPYGWAVIYLDTGPPHSNIY